jgi:O-antigen ligase
MISVYLTFLVIAPQDWVTPLLGLPVDYILYPIWAAVLLVMGRSKYLLQFSAQDKLLGGFVLWLYASAVANAGTGLSGHHLYMYAKWFVLYKMVAASLPSLNHLRRAAAVMGVMAMILVAESIQHFHSASLVGWAGQPLGWIDPAAAATGIPGRTQWVSIFDGPGVFCVLFTLTLPFMLQYVSAPYGFVRRITTAALLVPFGLAIYYTGSRGGFLATLAVLAMHFLVRTRISTFQLAAVGGALSTVFLAAPAWMTSVYDANRSAQHRVDMWGEGLEMVRYYPVFGVGRGNFADYTGTLIAHNSVIEIAAELGLPGILLWSAVIFMGFKTVLVYVQSDPDDRDRSYAYALGISLAGYLVSAMFVTLEYETLYFLLGMTAALGLQLDAPVRFSRRDAVAIIGLVGTFFVGLKVFVGIYY